MDFAASFSTFVGLCNSVNLSRKAVTNVLVELVAQPNCFIVCNTFMQ